MTTPNPWERLREAVAKWLDIYDSDDSEGWLAAVNAMREALAALPAPPPQQPVPDAEQPDDLGIMRDAKGLSERCRELRDRLVRLAHPVPAPQPEVVEMHSCEIPRLILNPGVLYRFTPAEGCQACADYHKPPRKPVPAPPASDWRERFDDPRVLRDGGRSKLLALRDGLIAAEDRIAALEAEVARAKEKQP